MNSKSWRSAWKLIIHPIRTEVLYFCPHLQKKYKNKVEVKVEDVLINSKLLARYLGVIFDHKLHWRAYLKHGNKLTARISLLR